MGSRGEKQRFERTKGQGGFNLVELMIALCILSFGILAVASMQGAALKGTTTANSVSEATTVAMDRMERIIALSYDDMVSAGSGTTTTGSYSVSWTVNAISGVTSARSINVTAIGRGRTVTLTCIKPEVLCWRLRMDEMRRLKVNAVKKWGLLRNEEGSILIVSLIMLVLLTLLGVTASMTSNIEVQIAGNEKRYRQNLYMAEAGAMQGVQSLEETDLESSSPAWALALGGADDDDIRDESFWSANAQESLNSDTRFLSVSQGIAEGSSLDVSKSQVYVYNVYGKCTQNSGQAIIELGYRKAF